MPSVCSHQDQSRKGVSATAHAVAAMRALESESENGLFIDPYAHLLTGDVGSSYVDMFGGDQIKSPYGIIDGVAVRTKKIDDEFLCAISEDNIRQICILGAGLDTRAWRLKSSLGKSIRFFEVDFPEIFDYKLSVLNEAGAQSDFDYRSVKADLSLDNWHSALIDSGFDVSIPTFWILEGLTGYLTESEASQLFDKITSLLSAEGSRIVATFLTPLTLTRTSMHRFFPENPLAFLSSFHLSGRQDLIEELGIGYNRPVRDKSMAGYYVVVVNYSKKK